LELVLELVLELSLELVFELMLIVVSGFGTFGPQDGFGTCHPSFLGIVE
jgi:hypothetical protein